MRCAEVGRLVDRYVDGSLAADRSAGLERHAAACAACRRLVAEARGVRRLLATDATAARAPRGFADRVMDRVYHEALWKPVAAPRAAAASIPARGYRRLGLCVMLGAAAAAALLVVPRAVVPGMSGSWALDGGSAFVERVLDGADGVVRGALNAAGGSAARIVEGGSR
jgi:anti-sigma factor RsiW